MKIEPGRELALAHRGPLRFAAQLKLIFWDARLLDMTPAERQAALRTLSSQVSSSHASGSGYVVMSPTP